MSLEYIVVLVVIASGDVPAISKKPKEKAIVKEKEQEVKPAKQKRLPPADFKVISGDGLITFSGRCCGLMVDVLVTLLSLPGSSLGRGHCVVLLDKTVYFHSASLHPGV